MEPISITIGTATALTLGGIAVYKYIEQKIQQRRAYVALIDLSLYEEIGDDDEKFTTNRRNDDASSRPS